MPTASLEPNPFPGQLCRLYQATCMLPYRIRVCTYNCCSDEYLNPAPIRPKPQQSAQHKHQRQHVARTPSRPRTRASRKGAIAAAPSRVSSTRTQSAARFPHVACSCTNEAVNGPAKDSVNTTPFSPTCSLSLLRSPCSTLPSGQRRLPLSSIGGDQHPQEAIRIASDTLEPHQQAPPRMLAKHALWPRGQSPTRPPRIILGATPRMYATRPQVGTDDEDFLRSLKP
jgi:hypothetical protein